LKKPSVTTAEPRSKATPPCLLLEIDPAKPSAGIRTVALKARPLLALESGPAQRPSLTSVNSGRGVSLQKVQVPGSLNDRQFPMLHVENPNVGQEQLPVVVRSMPVGQDLMAMVAQEDQVVVVVRTTVTAVDDVVDLGTTPPASPAMTVSPSDHPLIILRWRFWKVTTPLLTRKL
jgi:hypothetical protein